MADLVQSWLRRNPRVTAKAVAIGGAWVMYLPRDMSRYLIILGSDPATTVSWWLGDGAPTSAVYNFYAGSTPLILSEDVLGGVITQPFWLAAGAAISGLPLTAVSYQPEEHRIYEEMMYEFLSNRKSPGAY